MKIVFKPLRIATIAVAGLLTLSACTSEQVIDNTVGMAAGTSKLAARGVVGAGKLVVRGAGAAFDAATTDE
ncbi:hypothetical protein [Loktanella sp. S4079]|uniref:hypothetical protein n=1 Tax=Loktanella sp. S4079 TaxID=579483 RepID=UPI0005FA5D67|nr:hypothetical protein [Loktanella sp. S4079]KJZ18598.1 hypothetical protein TW80_14405 [Loktanella sp. S4079]